MIFLKKTLAVCMVGFGLRRAFSPSTSGDWLGIWNWDNFANFRASMAMSIKTENMDIRGERMKIVVYKPSKWMQGILRKIFGVKKSEPNG